MNPVFHSSLLRLIIRSQLRPVARAAPKPTVVQGETHYEVKKILDSRLYKGKLQYLVQWKGYLLSETNWVKSKDVKADQLTKIFHDRYPQKPKEPLGDGRGG